MHKRKEGPWVLIAPALLCIHAVLFLRFDISMDTSLFGHVLLKTITDSLYYLTISAHGVVLFLLLLFLSFT